MNQFDNIRNAKPKQRRLRRPLRRSYYYYNGVRIYIIIVRLYFVFLLFTLYTHRYYYTLADDATFNLLYYAARGALNPKVSPSRAKSRGYGGAKTNNIYNMYV